MSLKITVVLLAVSVAPIAAFFDSFNASRTESKNDNSSKIISRQKRFLIFPEGSSFQFVFCTQNHGYLQLGDIIWFAQTAAMAWELPDDPSLFKLLKSELRDPTAARRQDVPNKHIYYLDEIGKVIAKVPYKRKKTMNPVFAKRSARVGGKEITLTKKDFVKKMHDLQKSRSYLRGLDEASVNFHRLGRHGFFKKLATFFEAVGLRGHRCILRMLCEVGKAKDEQGTFIQELVRATFTLPKGANHYAEEGVEYDEAHSATGDCAVLYPECEDLDDQ